VRKTSRDELANKRKGEAFSGFGLLSPDIVKLASYSLWQSPSMAEKLYRPQTDELSRVAGIELKCAKPVRFVDHALSMRPNATLVERAGLPAEECARGTWGYVNLEEEQLLYRPSIVEGYFKKRIIVEFLNQDGRRYLVDVYVIPETVDNPQIPYNSADKFYMDVWAKITLEMTKDADYVAREMAIWAPKLD